jgi:transposase
MGRRIQIAPHLSVDELEQRYRQSKDGVERSHYQIIWLLAQGQRSEDVAAVTGYSRQWIYELVWGYNRLGAEALGDKRHQNPGAQPLLNEVQQAQLWQLLQEPAADGDLWDGPKVARWMSDLLGHPVHPQRGWDYLRGLGMRLRRPRPMHQETDPEEQQAWKKNWRRPLPT